jgi:transcriptional regulator with XRE-family HTH domain
MKVGEKIKKLRELKNYTQQYMSEQLELSLSGYGKIERDESDISISRLEKIADVLGVDISTILNFDERHIFNFNNQKDALVSFGNQHINSIELIEKIINQYKNENEYLKKLVLELTSKKN